MAVSYTHLAPDVPQMSQWQGRIKWTGTAALCNTSALLAKIADILGETQDAKHYRACLLYTSRCV